MQEKLWTIAIIVLPISLALLGWFGLEIYKLKIDYTKFKAKFIGELEKLDVRVDGEVDAIQRNCAEHHNWMEKQQSLIRTVAVGVYKLCIKNEIEDVKAIEDALKE